MVVVKTEKGQYFVEGRLYEELQLIRESMRKDNTDCRIAVSYTHLRAHETLR